MEIKAWQEGERDSERAGKRERGRERQRGSESGTMRERHEERERYGTKEERERGGKTRAARVRGNRWSAKLFFLLSQSQYLRERMTIVPLVYVKGAEPTFNGL